MQRRLRRTGPPALHLSTQRESHADGHRSRGSRPSLQPSCTGMRPAQTNIRREDGMGGECRNLAAHHHHWVHLTAYSNPHAERFVKSIKYECLNHFVFSGQRHLRYVIKEYMSHYLEERFHQGIGGALVMARTSSANDNTTDPIACRSRLGGLLNFYHRDAA